MKLKSLYPVSFWFGIIYLVLKLLSIPGMIMLYRAQNVSFTEFVYVISTNSFVANLAYFGELINGLLVGVLIVTISLSLIRNKISPNKMTNIGTIMVSIVTLLMVMLVIISIVLVISTPSIQTLLSMNEQLSRITYPIFPIFFFISILLLTAGYITEKLKTFSIKDFRIVLPSLAILVVTIINLIRILS